MHGLFECVYFDFLESKYLSENLFTGASDRTIFWLCHLRKYALYFRWLNLKINGLETSITTLCHIILAIKKCICFLFIWWQKWKQDLLPPWAKMVTQQRNCQVGEGDYTKAGASNNNIRENMMFLYWTNCPEQSP